MSAFWWGFLGGMFIGAWIGFFALAILVGARGEEGESMPGNGRIGRKR